MINKLSVRKDWNLIETFIDKNSKILDIGCGAGGLISQLEKNINASTRGIELNPELVRKAISKGRHVVMGNAELDLAQYSNQSFDYVVLSQTLQAMMRPREVLLELLRIGGKAIVSFPNFGHWKIRSQLLLTGKMPVTKVLPFAWYETPNIHFFTIRDFQDLCKSANIVIEKSIGLTSNNKHFEISSGKLFSNLFINEAIFLLGYQNIEPIRLHSKQKSFIHNSAIAN